MANFAAWGRAFVRGASVLQPVHADRASGETDGRGAGVAGRLFPPVDRRLCDICPPMQAAGWSRRRRSSCCVRAPCRLSVDKSPTAAAAAASRLFASPSLLPLLPSRVASCSLALRRRDREEIMPANRHRGSLCMQTGQPRPFLYTPPVSVIVHTV